MDSLLTNNLCSIIAVGALPWNTGRAGVVRPGETRMVAGFGYVGCQAVCGESRPATTDIDRPFQKEARAAG